MSEDLNRLVKVFVKMRDRKQELTAAYNKDVAKLDEEMEKVRHAMLDYCKDTNSESVRTESGTFYRTLRTKYWTSDWEQMHKFILETGELGLLEKRIQQTNMKTFLEDHPDKVPPGLNTNSEYSIIVKKPKHD